MRWIHRWPVISRTKASNTRKVSIWWRHHGDLGDASYSHIRSHYAAIQNGCDVATRLRKSPQYCAHRMMTSSNGNIFRVTGPLYGDFAGHRWIPRTQRPGTRSFGTFFFLNGWVNNGEAGDLRRHRSHYDVTVMDDSCTENVLWISSRKHISVFKLVLVCPI